MTVDHIHTLQAWFKHSISLAAAAFIGVGLGPLLPPGPAVGFVAALASVTGAVCIGLGIAVAQARCPACGERFVGKSSDEGGIALLTPCCRHCRHPAQRVWERH